MLLFVISQKGKFILFQLMYLVHILNLSYSWDEISVDSNVHNESTKADQSKSDQWIIWWISTSLSFLKHKGIGSSLCYRILPYSLTLILGRQVSLNTQLYSLIMFQPYYLIGIFPSISFLKFRKFSKSGWIRKPLGKTIVPMLHIYNSGNETELQNKGYY